MTRVFSCIQVPCEIHVLQGLCSAGLQARVFDALKDRWLSADATEQEREDMLLKVPDATQEVIENRVVSALCAACRSILDFPMTVRKS